MKAFTQQIIQESFKDHGIWLVNRRQIIEQLTNQLVIPDINTLELRCSSTPPLLLSSSVKNSPPATVDALMKNQAKIMKDITDISDKTKRNLIKVFQH